MNEKYVDILNESLKTKFYNSEDLKYNTKYGFMLSNQEMSDYNAFKEKNELDLDEFIELPLLSFNSKTIFYYLSNELKSSIDDFEELSFEYYNHNTTSIVNDNYEEVLLSQISSELEGTLKIEGINTTRKRINEIYEKNDIKDNNDQIILNMISGLKFIETKPTFNKENLKKLYLILSDKQLSENDTLKEYYRHDIVYIGNHKGCEANKIDECMNSLFVYVNDTINGKSDYYERSMLPIIVQYYILYIHPYFDFNGRTARMAFIWILYLNNMNLNGPIYLSEAINDDKNNYYKSIDYSRNSNNDLTYFATYLIKLANKYFILYKNLSYINNELNRKGERLTINEQYYLKRIMINKNKGWFNYKAFLNYCNMDVSKQGALKILNKFVSYGFLDSRLNSKKEKVFSIMDSLVAFDYSD